MIQRIAFMHFHHLPYNLIRSYTFSFSNFAFHEFIPAFSLEFEVFLA